MNMNYRTPADEPGGNPDQIPAGPAAHNLAEGAEEHEAKWDLQRHGRRLYLTGLLGLFSPARRLQSRTTSADIGEPPRES